MRELKRFHGRFGGSVNGHGTATAGYPGDTAREIREKSIDQEATRYLSAATQISIEYADLVVSRIMNEPFRALAPTFGIDIPVVVKWALQARRTRALRDSMLAIIFVLGLLAGVPTLWPQGLILRRKSPPTTTPSQVISSPGRNSSARAQVPRSGTLIRTARLTLRCQDD
jgi:hypothetical protein